MADSDRRGTLLGAYENAAVIVSGIDAGELGHPTPCPKAWGDDSSLSLRHAMPWGEQYTGATLVDMYLAELAAHAWDLARATGQAGKLDPSLALPALEGARAMIKPQYRNMVAPGAPFGAEVSPPPGADDWERLAAFMGRDPRASPGQ